MTPSASTSTGVVPYVLPDDWIKYNPLQVLNALVNAKAAVKCLLSIPFQRDWVDELQQLQLKMEVDGTSRIEGADFAGNELDLALGAGEDWTSLVNPLATPSGGGRRHLPVDPGTSGGLSSRRHSHPRDSQARRHWL